MVNLVLKYLAWGAGLAVLLFHSVYFRKLDERSAPGASARWDAKTFANQFWQDQLLPATQTAPDLSALRTLLQTNPGEAFARHSNALGIGNIRYFLVKGQGLISGVETDEVFVSIPVDTGRAEIRLATEFIYGNAARDASGLIGLQQFDHAADMDQLSVAINQLIRSRVVPGLRAKARKGQAIKFAGALELNQARPDLKHLEVIPLWVEITPAVAGDRPVPEVSMR